MEQKKFVGNAKEVQTKYGNLYKIGLNQDDLQNLMNEAAKNNGWVNIDLKRSQKGTWFLELNEYKAAPQQQQPQGWGGSKQNAGHQSPPATSHENAWGGGMNKSWGR
jgi:hypothetical protein